MSINLDMPEKFAYNFTVDRLLQSMKQIEALHTITPSTVRPLGHAIMSERGMNFNVRTDGVHEDIIKAFEEKMTGLGWMKLGDNCWCLPYESDQD